MKCFYHNDNDGKFAAQCVFNWVGIHFNEDGTGPDTDYIPINYNIEFPMDAILPGEQVWIVDYSIKPDEMRELLKITEDVTWIDHHKTAIARYADFDVPIRGVRKDGEAGCVLTFKYIHWWTGRGDGDIDLSAENKDIPVPEAITLVGDRDAWLWEYGDRTKYFNLGLMVEDLSVGSKGVLAELCFGHGREYEELMADIPCNGSIVEKIQARQNMHALDNYGFETELDGIPCFAVNKIKGSSEVFGDLLNCYAMCSAFVYDGEKYTVSLYSTQIDVSEIAKKHGGGGHKGAAGFVVDELPFKGKE